MVGGMLAATKAAPIMLSARHLGDDPVLLQRAFDGFEFWGRVWGVFQVLAFGTVLWALVTLLRPTAPSESRDIETESLVCVRRFCGSVVP